jgi:tRNA nucleotidyltransferase (CCA-adding enzyme)
MRCHPEVSQTYLDNETKQIIGKIRERGRAWIVGGWIRDQVLGINTGDVDIATNLLPKEVLEMFPHSIMVGEKFGTVKVRNSSKSKEVEVTTLRSDGIYVDGRRPENVKFGVDIEEDISRRDFTINAMALDEHDNLIDKFGGISDLDNNVLRCVGNADERIKEDSLRIMRAFRFIGLKKNQMMVFDSELKNGIINNVGMINNVSKERINQELKKIMISNNSMEILEKMNELGVLERIFDNIEIDLGVILSDDYIVNVALICKKYKSDGVALSKYIQNKLKISNREKEMIRFLHDNGIKIPDITDIYEIRRFRASLSEEQKDSLFRYLQGLKINTYEVERLIDNLEPLKVGNNPLVNGDILIQTTGLKPDIRLGKLKGWLHRKQIEMDLGDIQDVLELLNEIDWQNSDPEEWSALSWP